MARSCLTLIRKDLGVLIEGTITPSVLDIHGNLDGKIIFYVPVNDHIPNIKRPEELNDCIEAGTKYAAVPREDIRRIWVDGVSRWQNPDAYGEKDHCPQPDQTKPGWYRGDSAVEVLDLNKVLPLLKELGFRKG